MSSFIPIELMHIHLELECKGVDNGLLVRIPCDEPDDIARFTIARHADGYTSYMRYDVAPHIRDQLRALPPQKAWNDDATVTTILAADTGADVSVWRGRSYTFQRLPAEHEFPDVIVPCTIVGTPSLLRHRYRSTRLVRQRNCWMHWVVANLPNMCYADVG